MTVAPALSAKTLPEGNFRNDKQFDGRPSSGCVAEFGPPRDGQNPRTILSFENATKQKTSKNATQEQDSRARCQNTAVPEGNSRNDKQFDSCPSSDDIYLHFRRLRTGQPSPEGFSGVGRP